MKGQRNRLTVWIMLGFGGVVGLWSAVAMVAGLRRAGSLAELAREYMVATGMITPLHTLVDYYTHIKGIEYLICVAFFVIFPVFYRYVNRERREVPVRR